MWFKDNCIYIFGGWGFANVTTNTTTTLNYLGDMWRYNITSNEWTWIGGTLNNPPYGVYGTKGQTGAGVTPGGRNAPASWLGNDGLLYMFGGEGYLGAGPAAILADLWTYDINTGSWIWIGGDSGANVNAVFTKPGATGNIIGGINFPAFSYKNGKAYVYGGDGFSDVSQNSKGLLSILWQYDGTNWNWVAGSTQLNQATNYPVILTPVRSDNNESVSFEPVAPPENIAAIVAPSVIIPCVVVGVGLFVLLFLLKKKKANKKRKEQARLEAELEMKRRTELEGDIKYDALPINIETPADMQLIPRSAIELVKEIGAGSFGKVYKARYKTSDVAVKVSNVNTSTQDFLKEASFQMNIPPHPHIVQLLGISLDNVNVLVVLEFCSGGSLDKLLFDTPDVIPEAKQIEMAQQIAQGLKHLHDNNIVHRDLAVRNVLISANNDLKISDFGMSRKLQEQEDVGKTATNVGPIRWMAPESIGTRTYSKKSDIWTFGIILYEIVARQEPHTGRDLFEVGVLIRDKGFTPDIPDTCPALLAKIMKMCWNMDPAERPDIERICEMFENTNG